eukprot:1383413-Pyramimonas_sp.AAC.1
MRMPFVAPLSPFVASFLPFAAPLSLSPSLSLIVVVVAVAVVAAGQAHGPRQPRRLPGPGQQG